MAKQKSLTIEQGFEFAHDIAAKPVNTIHFVDPSLLCIEYNAVLRSFQCRPLRDALNASMSAALSHQPFTWRIVFIGNDDGCREMLEVVKE